MCHLVEMTQKERHLYGFGEHGDLGFGGTQRSGGLLLLAVHGVQQSLHPFWPSEPRKGGHSRAQRGPCGGLGHAGQVPRQLWSRSLLFWHLLPRPWWEGRGEQDVEGQSPTLGPALLCLAPGAWQRLRVGGGCCFWGKKKSSFILNLSALAAARAVLGAAGPGGAGGLRGARGERTGLMDEASRALSKDSLKRFLGVLCHPGASPAPLAEPALAEGGSCASFPATREQTPLFSAALGAAKPPARGRFRAAFPLPEEESLSASWPPQIPLSLGTRFWVRGMRHLCRALCRALLGIFLTILSGMLR